MGGALALDAAWLFAAFLIIGVLIAAGIAARRFLLERGGGTVECGLRRGNGSWRLGVASYQREELCWFGVFGLSVRPVEVFSRRDLAVVSRRLPSKDEAGALGPGMIVIECAFGGGDGSLPEAGGTSSAQASAGAPAGPGPSGVAMASAASGASGGASSSGAAGISETTGSFGDAGPPGVVGSATATGASVGHAGIPRPSGPADSADSTRSAVSGVSAASAASTPSAGSTASVGSPSAGSTASTPSAGSTASVGSPSAGLHRLHPLRRPPPPPSAPPLPAPPPPPDR